MNDDANPQGIQRPRLAVKKVYQDDPKTTRPMVPVHTKSRQRPTIAVGEGNNPQGMQRPDGKSMGEFMGSIISRSVYGQGVYNQADEI